MSKASATPYVKALFEIAVERGEAERVANDLRAFGEALASHPELRTVLRNRGIAGAQRKAVAERVADLADLSPAVRAVTGLLAARNEIELLPALARAYEARLRQHLGLVDAEVTTAVPLPDDRAQALAARLSQAMGKNVRVVTRVDPSILGGVVTRVGSTVYDGSLARQLERLRTTLAEV